MGLPNAEGRAGLQETVSPAGFLQPRPHHKGDGYWRGWGRSPVKPLGDRMSFPRREKRDRQQLQVAEGAGSRARRIGAQRENKKTSSWCAAGPSSSC